MLTIYILAMILYFLHKHIHNYIISSGQTKSYAYLFSRCMAKQIFTIICWQFLQDLKSKPIACIILCSKHINSFTCHWRGLFCIIYISKITKKIFKIKFQETLVLSEVLNKIFTEVTLQQLSFENETQMHWIKNLNLLFILEALNKCSWNEYIFPSELYIFTNLSYY